jgi:hypothetical protein
MNITIKELFEETLKRNGEVKKPRQNCEVKKP